MMSKTWSRFDLSKLYLFNQKPISMDCGISLNLFRSSNNFCITNFTRSFLALKNVFFIDFVNPNCNIEII